MLVLNTDPLADIANRRQILYVIKDGAIVDRDALPTLNVLNYDPAVAWPY